MPLRRQGDDLRAKPSQAKLANGTLTVVTGDVSDIGEWQRTHDAIKGPRKLEGEYQQGVRSPVVHRLDATPY